MAPKSINMSFKSNWSVPVIVKRRTKWRDPVGFIIIILIGLSGIIKPTNSAKVLGRRCKL